MDVIWNLTRVCPWNCAICCVSAFYAHDANKRFSRATKKEKYKELNLFEKLRALRILAERNFEIDFSGGDPLYYDEDFQVVEQATYWLPSKKISVSMTGSELSKKKIDLLKRVGVVEFTLDNLPESENKFRPSGFNLSSMRAMKKCVAAGVNVRAVTVLYPSIMPRNNLEDIYYWLCDNKVPEWELLRFYPVGRAIDFVDITPSSEDYLKTISFLKNLRGFTRVFFQHSLKILEGDLKCPAVVDSIGILPNGEVIACAWALDKNCFPFRGFYLGKLPEENLDIILDKAKSSSEFSKIVKFCRTIAFKEKKT